MTTAQTLVDRTRDLLLGGFMGERNRLAAPYTAGSRTLTFQYPMGGIMPGVRLSAGLNTFYVWDVNSSSLTATVDGGDDSTTDANLAAGTTVHVKPRFTASDCFNALNDEIRALSSPQAGLFQMKTFDLTYNNSIDGYDLSGITDLTSLQQIYEIRFQEPGPYKDWPRIPSNMWRLDRSALTSDFSSGGAIKLFSGGYAGYDVRVLYKAPFTTLTDLTTDIATTGLPATAYDLPPLGAAGTLMAGREIKRNFTESQPESRRAGEVPPGAVLNSARGLMIRRQERLMEEQSRLLALYPILRD